MTNKEAIEFIKTDISRLWDTPQNLEHKEALEKAIEALSEQRTGHWKRISMDKYVQHAMAYYRCSECGKDIIGEHNYCPNCGAKMAESEDKE
jgi:rubrerythrin